MDFNINPVCPLMGNPAAFGALLNVTLPFLTLPHIMSNVLDNCDIVGDYPKDQSSKVFAQDDPEYDFCVVGAGSAGSTIASRLSEVPEWKVLLVEAGEDPPFDSNVPGEAVTLFGSQADWLYLTEPSNDICRGYVGNQCYWSKGKAIGGSSSTNFMLAVRGNPKDYDAWQSMGNPGWAYKYVLPYFKKSEKVRDPRLSDKHLHGYDGPMYLEQFTNKTVYSEMTTIQGFIQRYASEAGFPPIEDIVAFNEKCFTISPGTIKDEVRWNTGKAYLQPARNRPNLVVMKGTLVTEIIIYKNTATGIIVKKGSKSKKIRCRKEVIVSAGSIASPQLLMLSGIGPKNDLKKMGIPVRQDLCVGCNLQDHFIGIFIMFVKIRNFDYSTIAPLLTYPAVYFINRTDAGNIPDTMIWANTTGYPADWPNIQYYHQIFPKVNLPLFSLFPLANFKTDPVNKILKILEVSPSINVFPANLRPFSRGSVKLRSTNPSDKPIINSGYLTDERDVALMIEAFQIYYYKIGGTEFFKKYAEIGFVDLDECKIYKQSFAKYIECLLRNLGTTVYHPVGTCKMGPSKDPNAVVSHELKVYGMKQLRVCDAAIMPTIVNGNTNLPTIMIGEKCADMIKKDHM